MSFMGITLYNVQRVNRTHSVIRYSIYHILKEENQPNSNRKADIYAKSCSHKQKYYIVKDHCRNDICGQETSSWNTLASPQIIYGDCSDFITCEIKLTWKKSHHKVNTDIIHLYICKKISKNANYYLSQNISD